MNDFDYLKPDQIYLDSACQSLRPRPVLNVLNEYYESHNSCGERVKYAWGVETDQKVEATRRKVLKYLGLKPREYFVSFTLNTTYGLNLVLSQLDVEKLGIKRVITSDIEHNSPFLSTMSFAETHKIPRVVIPRNADGSLPLDFTDFDHAVVVVNAACNFDGRRLENIKELTKTVHKNKGILIIDAAQAMAHSSDILHKTDADVICFSAHKMYAPSLGGIIVRRSLLPFIKSTFVGGGMVDDVKETEFYLSSRDPDHAYTKFESGLQAWGEIIALGAAIDWLESIPKSTYQRFIENTQALSDALVENPKIHLLNTEVAEAGAPSQPNPTMSFYADGLDSHLLGAALADQGIMARTGYFCVHYYLDHVRHYPPLIRFSLGYHNTAEDIEKVIKAIEKL